MNLSDDICVKCEKRLDPTEVRATAYAGTANNGVTVTICMGCIMGYAGEKFGPILEGAKGLLGMFGKGS